MQRRMTQQEYKKGGVAVGEFGHAPIMQISWPPSWQAFSAHHHLIILNPNVLFHKLLCLFPASLAQVILTPCLAHKLSESLFNCF